MAKSIFKKKFNGLNNKLNNSNNNNNSNPNRKCVNNHNNNNISKISRIINGINRKRFLMNALSSRHHFNHNNSNGVVVRGGVRARTTASYRYRRKSLNLSVVKCFRVAELRQKQLQSYAVHRHRHRHQSHTRAAIKTSINRLLKKNNVNKNKKHCIFYCRFGRCNKDKHCPYIHDSEKIAVCSRFLRGTCKINDCPLSHKLSREKMPVCSFFLQGRCNSDNCHYRHVNVNPDADICRDFNRGYCSKGIECKSAHIFVCIDFNRDGKCPKGESCPLSHTKVGQNVIFSKKKKGNKFRSHNCAINDNNVRHNNNNTKTSTDSHCLVSDPLPSFIPLCTDNDNCEHTVSATHSMIDNEISSNSETLPPKLSEKLKFFWIESDDEINYLSSDEEESEETSCRPAIRIFPCFINDISGKN